VAGVVVKRPAGPVARFALGFVLGGLLFSALSVLVMVIGRWLAPDVGKATIVVQAAVGVVVLLLGVLLAALWWELGSLAVRAFLGPVPTTGKTNAQRRVEETIIEVLCKVALADHVYDASHAIEVLWTIIDVPEPLPDDPYWQSETQEQFVERRLLAAGKELPEWWWVVQED
jgi:Na+-transporting methylmalonyl-CoA/oxaloacetate decarboxylase gamma subunit